jgi:cell division protein FtsB
MSVSAATAFMSETSYGDFKQRREQGVWHFLNRMMMALILFAGITLIICAFIPLLKEQRSVVERQDQLKAEIEKQKEIYARSSRELDLLKNDPEYVETVARDKLDLMKEGETIFRIEPPAPDKSKFRLIR